MTFWTVVSLVGAAFGIAGMYVANWAEHHPSSRERRSTRPHDIAFAIGMAGWAVGAVGLIAELIDHIQR